jgi:glucose-6-phosphate 1-dehydrogenase
MNIKNTRIPTLFVVLGVTGDLTAKKIVPALFSLHEKKLLPPKFEFVGVSRRDWTDADLKDHVRAILHVKAPQASEAAINSFLDFVTYGKIRFDVTDDYVALQNKLTAIDDKWGMCTNKLFYLSVPPSFYDEIFENLHKSHLTDGCGPDEGWTRIVVEKPFGSDEKSAKLLDVHLAKLFKEEQIYRIDHYLAKETFQNILAFRFFNNLFEEQWGNTLIEKISIRELENVGAEDRGSFYESVGAFRDVGQNHLLQMLSLTTMDQPRDLSADAIRKNRAAILETMETMDLNEIKKQTFRAQYDGYRTIKGVSPTSNVETYFRIRTSLSHPRWVGVPIILEAGKRLAKPNEDEITEIEVILKHPKPCLCASYASVSGVPEAHFKNKIIFRQDPKESITIHFWAKKPGFDLILEERTFEFDLRTNERKTQYTEEYEKLLLDCIAGDQTLFVSSPEIVAMWRFADPIIRGWAKNAVPLRHYKPDSAAIAAEGAVLMDAEDNQKESSVMKSTNREIGLYGLGKMGMGLAHNFRDKGWRVVVANRSSEPVEKMEAEGFEGAHSLDELLEKLSSKKNSSPRIVWLMVTAGKPVDDLLFAKDGLAAKLKKGDIVIDGGNSFFEDSQRRAKLLAKKGIRFLDVGVSGGPAGARNGACMMIGGDKKVFDMLEELFAASSVPEGYAYFGAAGSGHYVKMVHNGIEYGMMQSIAEGFALMKKSPYKLDLEKIAHLYNNGSVIESRLIGWMESGYQKFGQDLKAVSGSVAYTGEGEWTIKNAKKMHMKLPAIEDAFKFRVKSKKMPSYMGKILSTLRNQFGGHATDASKSKK